jgi:uncharacterized SAM-binding protein YcdF (DUF218 family)
MALRVLGAVVVAVFLIIAFTPLPDALVGWLARADTLRPAGAIVVRGGGGVRADDRLTDVSLRRTIHGIELYRRGLAPLLVLSGGVSADARQEAELRGEFALGCGLSPSAVIARSAGRTTREEGATLDRLLRERGIKTIVLVADAEGMRRAAAVFARRGFDVVAAPTADIVGFEGPPGDRLAHAWRILIETGALVYYWITGDV